MKAAPSGSHRTVERASKSRWVTVWIVLAALVASSVGAWSYFRDGSGVILSFSLLFGAAGALAAVTHGRVQILFANVAGVALVLGVLEVYFSRQAPERPSYLSLARAGQHSPEHGYFQSHPVLGYAPKRRANVQSALVKGGRVVYEARYTIDEHGFRAGSPARRQAARAVLFFGCSYTFGEGVNDEETLPSRFEEFDRARRRAINFGFHGYGPHHMLAMLEHGLEAPAVPPSRPEYAVYFALPDHAGRAAGRSSWDNGPRYELSPDGTLGWLSPQDRQGSRSVTETLMKSALMAHILERLVFRRDSASLEDWDRLVAIVIRSARLFEERYGGKFVALLGEDPIHGDWWAPNVADTLRRSGILVLKVAEIAASSRERSQFLLDSDPHPSAQGHEQLARALAEQLPE